MEANSQGHDDSVDFTTLSQPVRLEETVTTQETREAPSPTMGRDADTEWLLRNSG